MMDRQTNWYSFPGENTVKIVDVIRDHLRSVATGERQPDAVMGDMVAAVQSYLP